MFVFSFFFNDPATTHIYTLSLHDALPISARAKSGEAPRSKGRIVIATVKGDVRSEEHTSELQSRVDLVCRLLLEKKKTRARTTLTRRALVTSSHHTKRHQPVCDFLIYCGA